MFTLSFILADGIVIQLGGQVWSFGLNVLVFLLVVMVTGLLAESALLLFLVVRFLSLPMVQGQSANDVSLAHPPAYRQQERGKMPPTEDTISESPVPGC
jgi:hypothetical protein